MALLQKHEREILKALRAEGFTVLIDKTKGHHPVLLIERDGSTIKHPIPSSPRVSDRQVTLTLAHVRRNFKGKQ